MFRDDRAVVLTPAVSPATAETQLRDLARCGVLCNEATFHTFPRGRLACVKGAPEAVLPMCVGSRDQLARWDARATSLAAEGLRVLALAQGRVPAAGSTPGPHPLLAAGAGLDFLGFVGLADPLREGVREAVQRCGTAGIRVVMITGDHRLTSLAIARQLDLTHDADAVVTGDELAAFSPERLADTIRTARVFARVTPRQKLRIVEAARAAGHFVAVIEEGRIAYDNVRKVIFLLVSTGAAEMVLGSTHHDSYGTRRLSTTSGSAPSRTSLWLIGLARIMPATNPATWAE